jgi:hypothetical protein
MIIANTFLKSCDIEVHVFDDDNNKNYILISDEIKSSLNSGSATLQFRMIFYFKNKIPSI